MFGKRPIIHAVTSALVALCYLILAGASAVHEVSHIGGGHSTCTVAGDTYSTITDIQKDDPCSNDATSLPCFLCLIGHSYSTFSSPSFSHFLTATEAEEYILPVSILYSVEYALPSLRAPPSAC